MPEKSAGKSPARQARDQIETRTSRIDLTIAPKSPLSRIGDDFMFDL
ncbi:MAG: hypothetical protein OXF56_25215 [Rhodobacteraceae bacterium]|nr:hypothetical protein [Paracoccaceae bacterium]